MPLPDPALEASQGGARTILFGLFADGSAEARFARADGALFGMASGRTRRLSGFSPADDWYGRWAVPPLRGILAERPGPAVGILPEDIVVVGSRRPSRTF